jgi:hypothetical protein
MGSQVMGLAKSRVNNKTSVWFVCAVLVLALTGCAAPYRVIPVLPDNPQAAKLNSVSVEPLSDSRGQSLQGQYSRPKFRVTVKNNTKQAVKFSTENIQATLNGEPAKVMSFDAQVDELLNVLRVSSGAYPSFYPALRFSFGSYGRIGSGVEFDPIDIQRTQQELYDVRKNALRPTVLDPGTEYSGEITLKNKLPAQRDQEINLTVEFAGEAQSFQFALQQLSR